MAPERILILGGAGFIGNHLTRALAQEDYEVCVLDSLERQVHGEVRGRPDSLAKGVRFVRSRVSNLKTLKTLIKEVDAVVNLAAVVGVGQSMYAIRDYVDKNTGDTAALLDALVNHENQVSKLIVASSMSVYGEGQYYCSICKKPTFPCLRNEKRLSQREWDHLC